MGISIADVNRVGFDARDYNNDGYPEFFYNNLPGQVFALFQNGVDYFGDNAKPADTIFRNEGKKVTDVSSVMDGGLFEGAFTMARHWLSLEVTGARGSRDAVGAGAKVTLASGNWRRGRSRADQILKVREPE